MRKIDMKTWPRREHFKLFNTFNHPHFNLCVNVDLTAFHSYVKEQKLSFTPAILYLIARSANAVPEFRHRIRDGDVVEHETISPSVTILAQNNLFGFCTIDYSDNFNEFADRAAKRIAATKKNPSLEDPVGRDDLMFMTVLPWISFTSFSHPMHLHPTDCIPRFAWGKYFWEGESLKMPLSVQGHHALMDGFHMGRFYTEVQEYLHRPAQVLV